MARDRHYFIQSAIKHAGALRAYVQREYGSKGFDSKGRIKPSVEKKIASGKCAKCGKGMEHCECPGQTTQRRARFAQLLRRINA